jgi:biotin carboxylase
MKKTILCINPYSSGVYLHKRFNELGYRVFCLQTFFCEQSYLKSALEHQFDLHMRIESSNKSETATVATKINEHNVVAGIIGLETDYNFSEQILRHLFSDSANNYVTADYRCNKSAMQQRLAEFDYPTIDEIVIARGALTTEQSNQVAAFYQKHNQKVIVKPCKESAASNAVFTPESFVDITHYITNYKNALFADSDILIQKKIEGVEYYINTASYNSRHIISGIGIAIKGAACKNIYKECLPVDNPRFELLSEYAQNLLNILEVKTGLSHIEVMLTELNEIFLIELNPRIAGNNGRLNQMEAIQNNYDQIQAFIDLLENRTEKTKPETNTPTQLVRLVYLHNLTETTYEQLLTYCETLDCYHSHYLSKLADKPKAYSSLLDLSASVILCHTDKNTLDNATSVLQLLEQTEL